MRVSFYPVPLQSLVKPIVAGLQHTLHLCCCSCFLCFPSYRLTPPLTSTSGCDRCLHLTQTIANCKDRPPLSTRSEMKNVSWNPWLQWAPLPPPQLKQAGLNYPGCPTPSQGLLAAPGSQNKETSQLLSITDAVAYSP